MKGLLLAISTALTLGTAGGNISLTEQKEDTQAAEMDVQETHVVDESAVKEEAEKFGISTDGKDVLVLEKEIQEEKLRIEAESLGIETDGKGTGELSEEIYKKKLTQEAEAIGISTEGKSLSALTQELAEKRMIQEVFGIAAADSDASADAKELYRTRLTDEAKSLGIETAHKELETIAQAQELGISMYGKGLFQLLNEIQDAKIRSVAGQLGIYKEGSSLEELAKEIKEKFPQQAKRIEFVPWLLDGNVYVQ